MFDQLRHPIADWFTYSDSVWKLSLLDDRLLQDAGIRRSQIRQQVRRALRASRGC